MMLNESIWIKNRLKQLQINSVLNIGSSDLNTRKKIYPYIDENIFEPLRKRNIKIVHTDIKNAEGVDIVGDLTDPVFFHKLASMKFDCILCNNLLEHLTDKQTICRLIQKILLPGGYIIVTVPYRYPYHYDPIDTMLRPTVKELSGFFPDTILMKGDIISDNGTYWNKLKNDRRLALIIFIRSFLPFYKPKMWWNTVSYLPNMFKKFQVCCVLLKNNYFVPMR